MNEVGKMYKIANIKAKEYCDRDSDACMNCCPEWKNRQNCWKYKSAMPPFTAEKQLELIKWLSKRPLALLIGQYKGRYYLGNSIVSSKADDFDNSIAIRINDLWQSLTKEERKQIKEILE